MRFGIRFTSKHFSLKNGDLMTLESKIIFLWLTIQFCQLLSFSQQNVLPADNFRWGLSWTFEILCHFRLRVLICKFLSNFWRLLGDRWWKKWKKNDFFFSRFQSKYRKSPRALNQNVYLLISVLSANARGWRRIHNPFVHFITSTSRTWHLKKG